MAGGMERVGDASQRRSPTPIKLPSDFTAHFSLQQFGSARSFESFPVFPDDADFLSVESRELYRLPQKRIFIVLIVCGKSAPMNNHHVSLSRQEFTKSGNTRSTSAARAASFFTRSSSGVFCIFCSPSPSLTVD